MEKPLVGILMGSESDMPVMGKAAEVLKENEPMLRVFEKMRFPMESRLRDSVYELTISLK